MVAVSVAVSVTVPAPHRLTFEVTGVAVADDIIAETGTRALGQAVHSCRK